MIATNVSGFKFRAALGSLYTLKSMPKAHWKAQHQEGDKREVEQAVSLRTQSKVKSTDIKSQLCKGVFTFIFQAKKSFLIYKVSTSLFWYKD